VDDWKGYDFYDMDNGSQAQVKHGTLIAGIVAAKTNNGKGVAGIAGGKGNEGVKLMIIRIGHPLYGVQYLKVDDAIIYACQNGARVIVFCSNVSDNQTSVEEALSFAYHSFGVVIVAAAGNDYPYTIYFPASDEHVIAVGATTSNDTKAGFSCYGPDLDIAAPGVNIYSTTISNGYEGGDEGTGTSFASPQVAATVALLLSVNPFLTPDEIREILKNSADKVPPGIYNYNWNPNKPGHSQELGYGRLNVYNALSMIYPYPLYQPRLSIQWLYA
jgi:serine protease